MADWVKVLIAIGAVALFFAAFFALIWCVAIAIIRKRFTLKLLLVMLTSACIFVGFVSICREAAHRNSIELIEFERKFYEDNQDDFSPHEFQRLMRDLDDRAATLGAD
jgi:hypothetical protein